MKRYDITEFVSPYYDFYSIPAIKMDSILKIDLSRDPIIKSAFDILIEFAEKHPMYVINQRNDFYYLTQSYLQNLLSLINYRKKINIVNDDVINDAVLYIQKHFYEALTTLELAQRYHIDESIFIKKFKQNMNTTPYQYIKSVRLHIAYSLLKKSSLSVTEIAQTVGYSDVSSFSHAMKKTYGIYPRDILNEDNYHPSFEESTIKY